MPVLDKISVQNFRNIELQELEFSSNVNCISGDNGEGKTNLLDAIWYLAMTKGAFSTSDRYNCRYGCSGFAVSGVFTMENGSRARFAVSYGPEGKKVSHDGKQYEKISEHIGLIPIVSVSPSDTALVSESGEERRRFVNSVLSQMDRQYLSDMQNYNRLLATRNVALKGESADETFFEVIDARMEEYGRRIFEARKAFAADLEPVVRNFYSLLSSDREKVGIEYRSDLQEGPLDDILRRSRDKDNCLRYTTAGIQRDDFVFTMNSHSIRKCGSQGQQKSFLVSLKFAQYEIMKKRYGFAPILLLDDLFDKLDMQRVENLLRMVSGSEFGQIFISDTNKVRTDTLLEGLTTQKSSYTAKGGVFERRD